MPISYTIDKKRQLVLTRAWGVPSIDFLIVAWLVFIFSKKVLREMLAKK